MNVILPNGMMRKATIGLILALLVCLFSIATNSAVQAQNSDVLLVITPASTTVPPNGTFTVMVRVQAGTQQVDSASAYIDFDPTLLQVQQLNGGTALDLVLENNFDNSSGEINFSAGSLSSTPSGTFDLVEIEFQTLNTEQTTPLDVQFASPRQSSIFYQGNSVITDHTDGTVTIRSASSSIHVESSTGLDSMLIDWSLEGTLSGDLDDYQLYRRAAGEPTYTLMATQINSRYTDNDPNLVAGTEYCYQVNALDKNENIIGTSNTECLDFGALTLWVPDEIVPPGSTDVQVPINLINGNGLCMGAMDITISYDDSIATVTGDVSPTIYTQGYTFLANTSVAGQVKISAIGSCTQLYAGGSLFNVGFDIIGAEDDVSPLDFITGLEYTAIYDDNNLFNEVDLVLQNGSLTVQTAFIRGDVNGDGVVNAADSRLALYITNGRFTPNSPQRNACDVNGDQACNSADSSLILCYAAYQSWETCGGVNATRLLQNRTPLRGAVGLAIDDLERPSGSRVIAPVSISNATDLFAGAKLTFIYDADRMSVTNVLSTSLTSDFQVESHIPQAGILQVSLASATPISGDGPIFEIEFTSSCGISSIDFAAVKLNDNVGRDLETSALQKEIQLTPHDSSSDDCVSLDVTSTRSNDDVLLNWPNVSQDSDGNPITVTSYDIWRSSEPYFMPGDAGSSKINTVSSPSVSDSGVIGDGNSYYYAVVANTDAGKMVETSSRVGKFSIPIFPGWNLLSLSLLADDTNLDTVIGNQLYGTDNPLTADRILAWDASTQSYSSAWFCGGACEAWGEPWANHWLANDYSPTPLNLQANKGFWLQNRSGTAETLVLMGTVATESHTTEIGSDWQMLSSIFPQSQSLDEMVIPATGTDNPLTADRILTWDASSQSYTSAWYCAGACEAWGEPWANHWLANDYSLSPINIHPGHGFWYQNRHDAFSWENTP